jgi:hypothetical protein
MWPDYETVRLRHEETLRNAQRGRLAAAARRARRPTVRPTPAAGDPTPATARRWWPRPMTSDSRKA